MNLPPTQLLTERLRLGAALCDPEVAQEGGQTCTLLVLACRPDRNAGSKQ